MVAPTLPVALVNDLSAGILLRVFHSLTFSEPDGINTFKISFFQSFGLTMVARWKMNRNINEEKKKKQEEREMMEEKFKKIGKERKQLDEVRNNMIEERKMLDEEWNKFEDVKNNMEEEKKNMEEEKKNMEEEKKNMEEEKKNMEEKKKNMEEERKKIIVERECFTDQLKEEMKMMEKLEIGDEKVNMGQEGKKVDEYRENMVEKEKMETVVLPTEMMERVFRLLPPRDLKAVVLVCRWWRKVGEAPALWAWVCFRVGYTRPERDDGSLFEMMDSRRLQAMRRMEVSSGVSDELLQAVVNHPGLKEIQIGWIPTFSSVNPHLFGQALAQLEEVQLFGANVSVQQVAAICTAMSGNSNLKKLNLSNNLLNWDQSEMPIVDANILAQAVSKLEEVGLQYTTMNLQQVEAIFAALNTSSHLKVLDITGNDLSSVDPDVLARVVSKLETADISNTFLTEQQMDRILTKSILHTNLKELDMRHNGIVDLELRSQAEQVIQNLRIDNEEYEKHEWNW